MRVSRGRSGVRRASRCCLQVAAILLVALPFLEATPTDAVGRVGGWPHGAAVGERFPAGVSTPRVLPDTPDWSVLGESDGDDFGWTVEGAGDVNGDGYADVIVAAEQYSSSRGKVYLFYGSASGLSTAPDWSATGEDANEYFGRSIAGAGDVNGDGYDDVLIGALFGAGGKGKVYVYTGSPGGLSPGPAWTATGADSFDFFGGSVSGAGDVNGDGYADIIVGAYGAGPGGEVYLYLGGPGGIGARDWTASAESSGDEFGCVVAGAGDVNGDGYADIAVGAHEYGIGRGAAYVYAGSATGLSATPGWAKYGAVDLDHYGRELAAAGDVNGDGYADLAVAASNLAGNNEGRVYVYAGSASGLAGTHLWTAVGTNDGDRFGRSLDSAGDVDGDGYADLIVGAPGWGMNRGIIYVYAGSPTGLITTWLTYGENDNDSFGCGTAGAGDVNGDGFADIIAGAHGYPSLGGRGKAYGYYGGGDPVSFFDEWHQTGQNAGDKYGASVAAAGDVNGDGYTDVVVGAPGYPGGAYQGKAYAYYGSPAGLSASPNWTAVGEQDADSFGRTVAAAGDVNGDGYADVIVGVPNYPGLNLLGKVHLYYGGPTGLSPNPIWTAKGEIDGDGFGSAVGAAGDVNGDGYADVVVGAVGFDSSRGKVYVYYGSAEGPDTSADWTALGENNADSFGQSVAGAGDVNGDGYADLVVGAHSYPSGSWRGKVYVYHGGPSGPGSMADWTESGETTPNYYGFSVSTAGDVNGDGCADVIVGAGKYPSMGNRGKVYVYYGAPGGLGGAADWTRLGENDDDEFGGVVATAGDVDGDGFAEVIIGTERYLGGTFRGKAYLFSGAAGGLSSDPIWVSVGEDNQDNYAVSAASAGDVNGDGFADLIVGAYGYSAGALRGKVYLYYGNQEPGRGVLARQLRGDGRPVQPWGSSDQGNSFVAGMRATHPMGRGRVKLEVEACPAGLAFGDGACIRGVSSTWRDVTATSAGVEFKETVSGLAQETLYHWRARVLYAPYTVDRPGIVAPPNPAHGPWRRFQGQALEADLRTPRVWDIYLPVVVRRGD